MTLHAGPMIYPKIIACHTCGFSHWHPLPDASTVARYYEEDKFYSQHSPPDWFKKEEREHSQGYWLAYYDYLISFLKPFTPTIDIGAGAGWFVQRCPYALGVEPSVTARKFSPVPDDMLVSLGGLKGGRGNIVLMLTLEHILDPETWLREEILPHLDGRLIITVPNEMNPLQKALRSWHFVSPVHLNYFTPDTLKAMLERLNLRVVHTSTTFPMEAFAFIGRSHIGNDEIGRRNHLLRLRVEKALGVRAFKLYEWLYRLFGIGREIIMVAEWKKS